MIEIGGRGGWTGACVDGFFGAGTGSGTLWASAALEPIVNAATSAATRAFRMSVSAAPALSPAGFG
jgi:hypothetical protein